MNHFLVQLNQVNCPLQLAAAKPCVQDIEELYKRWYFDNVKEYLDRKQERISKKLKPDDQLQGVSVI